MMRSMQLQPKILLVEDDYSISSALTQVLQSTYEVDVAPTGQLALHKIDFEHYDIVVLDLNLPDMSGVTICQLLCERNLNIPILILTGDANVLSKVKMLNIGANDYMTKPFSVGELKARLRVISRTHAPQSRPERQLSVSGVVLDRNTYQVSREGIAINLRRKEFALLECLMENAGSVVTREALIRYAWQGAGELFTNTVDVHIKYLRDKIDRPFEKSLIMTVHGLGYKLEVKL